MNKFLNNLILFFLLLSAGSVYVNIFGGELLFLSIATLSIFSLTRNSIIKKSNAQSLFNALATTIGILVFNWLITGFNLSESVYPKLIFRVIVINLALFSLVSSKVVHFSFSSFLPFFKIITIHAFLSFIFGFFIKHSLFLVPSDDLIVYTFYYIFFYLSTFNIGSFEIFRSQGLFWEPGVLAMLLNLFLFFLLFKSNKDYFFRYLVSFLIVTTFSTTGMVMMGLLYFIYFNRNGFKLKNIAYLLLFSLLLYPIMFSNITNKVSGEGELSFLSRNYDAQVSFEIIKANPLFGIGVSNEAYSKEQKNQVVFIKSEFEETRQSSNSILSTFVGFGIPLAVFFFVLLYKQNLIQVRRFFFFLILIIFLSSEPLIFSGFILLFICSSFYDKSNFTFDG